MSETKSEPWRIDNYTVVNDRRIVACLNACQGIRTETLESGALEVLLVAGQKVLELERARFEMMRPTDKVMAQGTIVKTCIELLESAIAKVKGSEHDG